MQARHMACSTRATLISAIHSILKSSVRITAFGAAVVAADASAQAATGTIDEVVVTGQRVSIETAQEIKQNASQIVDSIVAEDIGKLPDNNVSEALQRITGIQIDRNYGEGSNIAIRGLTQVRTELNGRDIFTANDGRALSLEDVAAELLAGVDVYKNPSAEMIEGGLGGTIDLRTRKPFDYDGMRAAGSATYNYFDLAEEGEVAVSGLFSDRWEIGNGELGVLVNVSVQDRSFRQDTISVEPWWEQTDIPGFVGTPVFVPHGAGTNTTLGDRKRKTGSLALQWQPNDSLELYAQVQRTDYDFYWRDYSFFAYTGNNPIQGFGNFEFNDRNELIRGTFQNVPVDSNTSLTERNSITTDYSLGAKWDLSDAVKVATDFQYIDATTETTRYIVSTGINTTPRFHMDLSGDLPRLAVTDATGSEGYLADIANYAGWRWHLDNKDDNEATEFAWRADLDWALDAGFARGLRFGVRYTDRDADNLGNVWRFMCLNNCAGAPYAGFPNSQVTVGPIRDFFRGEGYAFGPTAFASNGMVADYEGTLAMFGATPLTYGPTNRNVQGENTYAGYGLLTFGSDDIPIDGNVGVRVVRTEVETRGVLSPRAGQFLPLAVEQTYTETLPSLNVRWKFTDDLQWRIALSKAISRPTFDKLSPNLGLDLTNGTGSAGNPNLKPLTADQADTSLEWYFGRGSMLYGALFYKKVDGFIANTTFNEQYLNPDLGQVMTFAVTRPVNGDDGKIKGVEVGYTQFFDFLPAPFDGFGVQLNYTYVDSQAPSPSATDTSGNPLIVPLEGLSEDSYNAIAMYENELLSARIAYNWRSEWLVTTAGNGTGNLPVYNDGFGQLDASFQFKITDVWSISLDGTNLTDTRQESYLGYSTRFRDWKINDRRYGITVRANL